MTLPASGPLAMTDIQTEFGGTNPIGLNEYYAGGGLVPAGTSGTYGAVPSSGALSIQNFYGTSNYIPVYIEELFQTWVYSGNGSTQTITNGIDLSGNGGLTWFKTRYDSEFHTLFDTARGTNSALYTNATNAAGGPTNGVTSFNSNGFTVGSLGAVNGVYGTPNGIVSWTFRKQPKFFDIVTYTGNGVAGRQIAHNLGSVPGVMIVKSTSSSGQWPVYHRSTSGTPQNDYLLLNQTAGAYINQDLIWNNTAPTSTVFTVGSNTAVNANGVTYVAYLFAHNAGGFGLTGTDNVISCGSYTGTGAAGLNVTLGYEPQFVLIKRAVGGTGNWNLIDTMRGWPNTTTTGYRRLLANTSAAEDDGGAIVAPTATGFTFLDSAADLNGNGSTYIYIAIRRGPMKVPTTGTSVFVPANASGTTVSTNFPVDMFIKTKKTTGSEKFVGSRLFGPNLVLQTQSAVAEISSGITSWDNNTALVTTLESGTVCASWIYRRAPSFMDVVCYTGTQTDNTQIAHNLGVAPELIITKKRSSTGDWWTLCTADATRRVGRVNLTNAFTNSGIASTFGDGTNYVAPTASVFTLGSGSTSTNTSGSTYVAYLFASCPGVSKVGSFTGTGATQTINCGFTSGARFVLIKATSTAGDWFVWDSARGISGANDPYLMLNNTTAEVTNTNWVDTATTGFQLIGDNSANSNGVSYIFLAIS